VDPLACGTSYGLMCDITRWVPFSFQN